MSEQRDGSIPATEAEYWNSAGARQWSVQHERTDRAFAGLGRKILDVAAPKSGEHVLDIGCGAGTTVLDLAERVGPGGRVLGADISEPSVTRGRERIAAAGLRHAELICTDVAHHSFAPGSFDLVFSRLGVMFFGDPMAAFANVHRAMKPGGRLALGVFRVTAESAWPTAAVAAVRHLVPPAAPQAPDQPGMFSLADPARVQRILTGAGFRDVSLEPFDHMVQLAGRGGAAEAADFAMVFGPLTRVLPRLPQQQQDAVRSALHEFFAGHLTPEAVTLRAAFWIVQARA